MNDAVGNVYSLGFVFAFILIVASFLAYVINYNRAFQMKNRLLEIIKERNNELPSGTMSTTEFELIENELKEYKEGLGYSAGIRYIAAAKEEGWTCPTNFGWCYKIYPDPRTYAGEDISYTYVKVMTFVSIDVPIINNIFSNLSNFRIVGSTVPTLVVKDRS